MSKKQNQKQQQQQTWAMPNHDKTGRRRTLPWTGSVLVLVLLVSLAVTTRVTSSSDDVAASSQNDNDSSETCHVKPGEETCTTPTPKEPLKVGLTKEGLECKAFMAPSTLGNHSNLGIYTGQTLEAGQVIPYPEIAIPLLCREWGTSRDSYAYGDGMLWDKYIWPGRVVGLEVFDDFDRSQQRSVFVPGVGCTTNSMLDLHNIDSTHGGEYEPLVPRNRPTAGSFSPYHGSVNVANRPLEAGSELLASYGAAWIPQIPGAVDTQDKFLDAGDDFLQDLYEWIGEMISKHGAETITPRLLERLWKLTTSFPHPSKILPVLPKQIDWQKVLQQLQLQQEASATTTTSSTLDTRSYWRSKQYHSLEWLQEHGHCQDHLRPGISTITDAGRGAFAARNLPKGSVVSYAPLIHVGRAFWDFGRIPYQDYSKLDLVINYSFSHPNSTLVLTPYGAMVNYINHAPAHQANVRVQWPTRELVAHKPDWLNKPIDELQHILTQIGLSFEYIALRDIQEGEEIFMDYGPDWEQAWQRHVERWVPPPDSDTYQHSSQYGTEHLKTAKERREDPYPSNLITVCKESYTQRGNRLVFVPVLRDWQDYVPCEVLDRSRSGKYTVKLVTTRSDGREERLTVFEVPSPEGVILVDKAYSQDWHLPQAFRHPLQVPDDMFPESWKNKLP